MLRRVSSNPASSRSRATARPMRRMSAQSSRSNGMSLRERLASRKNPTSAPRGMSLREMLASRANPEMTRSQAQQKVATLTSRYETLKNRATASPSAQNRRLLAEARNRLQDELSKIEGAKRSILGGRKAPKKASTRKSSTRKSPTRKSSARKSSAKKSSSRKVATRKSSTKMKSGVASLTKAYKGLRKASTRGKFTRAFNTAFKKAKSSGKSVTAAQSSAVAAGKRAVSRKNPASPASARSAIASLATRSNPRKKSSAKKSPAKKSSAKKSSAKKSSAKKSSVSSRKPRSVSAIVAHGKKTKWYKRLSASKKTAFLREFKKSFTEQNRKRGVTESQAVARAALIAGNRVSKPKRRNPSSDVTSALVSVATRSNPRKKSSRKKASSKKASRKVSSKRATGLEAIAKKTALYKRLKTAAKRTAFISEFKKSHARIARKASSSAQANARTALSAYSKVTKGGTRMNPAKKRSTSKKRSSSAKRVRGQRMKRSMSKSAKQAVSVAGIYTYKVVIGGKAHTLKVSKNSSEYKAAKRGGLRAVKMAKLRGKKNTPTSLNLRSVYKICEGRPSKKDFQRAVNAWAGAIEGGHIRGVSKRDVSRTRRNPANVRRHTVRAISNPAPMMAMSNRMARFNESRSTEDMLKLGGLGLISFAGSMMASNYIASSLGRAWAFNVTAKDVSNKSGKYYGVEALSSALFALSGGYVLYQKYVNKSVSVSDKAAVVAGGFVAGSLYSLLARTVVKGLGKIPGFKAVAESGGDVLTFAETPKKASTPTLEETAKAEGYLLDYQPEGSDMSSLYGRNGLGRYVAKENPHSRRRMVPVDSDRHPVDMSRRRPAHMGTYIPQDLGAYVEDMGAYVEDMGSYVAENPAPRVFGVARSNPAPRVFGVARSNPLNEQIPSVVSERPNRAPRVPDGMYEMADYGTLKDDISLQTPLSKGELEAEGLTNVYSNGNQMHIIRATPDVARQIVEANFGSIIGPSRVIRGSVLVLANIFDTQQDPVLSDRLRLGYTPNAPKGASFPAPGGIFSRVAFSSVFPSINNQPTYQEFGVKIN